VILLISASWAARITGMSHDTWLNQMIVIGHTIKRLYQEILMFTSLILTEKHYLLECNSNIKNLKFKKRSWH
jgi:hypothetical protein